MSPTKINEYHSQTNWGDELKSDPDVAAMVERRWAEYGLGDLDMGEADPNLFGYDIR
ncbi:MAG: hypothetical protein AAFX51_19150 [Cyanobacteria bacterium J06636_28]